MDDEELIDNDGARPSDNDDEMPGLSADIESTSDGSSADNDERADEPAADVRIDDEKCEEDGEENEPDEEALDRADTERRTAVRMENRVLAGSLVLHYEARDVQVVLDGDSALRVLTAFARRDDRDLSDPIDPSTSSAFSGWFVADLDQPLAISWIPGLGGQRRRTVIDPPVAAA